MSFFSIDSKIGKVCGLTVLFMYLLQLFDGEETEPLAPPTPDPIPPDTPEAVFSRPPGLQSPTPSLS